MAPITLYPKGKTRNCTITSGGTICLPQRVVEQLKWKVGIELTLSYILNPLTILLWRTPPDRRGFKLCYLSRSGNLARGGKLTCRAFATQVLHTRVALPQTQLSPAFLHHPPYDLALSLEEPAWQTAAFTVSGIQSIPSETVGLYEILSAEGKVQRIGHGKVSDRLQCHLKDEHLVRLGRSVRYADMEKDDAVIIEKVRLALHEETWGELPTLNVIRA